MLAGVLFDVEGDALRTVATDRYRMAVARAGAAGHDGPRARFIVPSPLADAMRALLADRGDVQLAVNSDRVTLEAGGREVTGQCLDHDFPDYRRLVRLPARTPLPVDGPAFRAAVETGPVRVSEAREGEAAGELSLLAVADGTVAVCADIEDGAADAAVAADTRTATGSGDGPLRIAVNRKYLLDALTAAAGGRLLLEFGEPTAPLVIRRADTEDAFSLLMPVRLEN
jgi:DNA polymerase III sliding clamp (beta) subunit (PCNA family)